MTSMRELDNPWRRLPWSLPLALAICAGVLWEFGRILERRPVHETAPVAIEAELVELPPPPVVERVVKPEPERPKPAPERPKPAPERPKPAPERAKTPVPASIAPAAPAVAATSTPLDEDRTPTLAAPPPLPAPAQSAARPAPDTQSAGTATMGAQAIVRPMPQIPDDLREDAFNTVAVVRFHIAVDGVATFELAKPTSNPRLNRLLLEKLRGWRFFPAMRDGKPVPSDQDVRITFDVK
jgi:protein TonB